ncbi:hypothetical protein AGMMS50267_16220 [Spirochaetia bacterium]|nr:hypothetical protein AGMMS50267_16220 [Spirochaetia bacterium]
MKKKIAFFALIALISALSPLSVFAQNTGQSAVGGLYAPADPDPAGVSPNLTPTNDPAPTAPVGTGTSLPPAEAGSQPVVKAPPPLPSWRSVPSTTSENDEVPKWVIQPDLVDIILVENGTYTLLEKDGKKIIDHSERVLIGMGSAKAETPQKAIQLAEARARQDIATQLDSKVQARIRDYTETRDSNGRTANSSISSVAGTQATSISISNVKVEKRDQTKDKTWWVLVTWKQAAEVPDDDESYRERAQNEFNQMEGVTPAAAAPAPVTPAIVPAAVVTAPAAVIPVTVTPITTPATVPADNPKDEQAEPAALKVPVVSD